MVNASDQTKDYATKGYVARNRAEELPATGYSVSITQEIKNVTSEVLNGIPDTHGPERTAALQAKLRTVQGAAARPAEGIAAQVSQLNEGLTYYLFTYLVLRDVRIVYAPPKSIGFFGGDPDNFEWPRHCGDFTFMRAYVGPDGKPATYAKTNVPSSQRDFYPGMVELRTRVMMLRAIPVRRAVTAKVIRWPTTRMSPSRRRGHFPQQIEALENAGKSNSGCA